MDNQRKEHINSKRSTQNNHFKQPQTHNSSTYDVENNNGTNKGRDLLLTDKPWIVPWGIERILQRIQRHNWATLHWSVHARQEQDEM